MGIKHLKREGVHLFLDPEGPNWVSTNTLGARVLASLKSEDVEKIASSLADEWGINYAEALSDVRGFLDELMETEIKGLDAEKGLTYPGRSKVIGCGRLQELWIYTNNSCNLRCSHCFLSAGDAEKDEMDTSQVKDLINEARELGVFRFYFTGGEPFLREDIFELIEFVLSRKGDELAILSNGTLLNKDIIRKLRKFKGKNLTIQVSLDGPDPMTNDLIRGRRSFERALEGIKNLVKLGLPPVVSTTLTGVNKDHMNGFPRLLAGLGVRHHHIIFLQNTGRAAGGDKGLWVSSAEVSRVMEGLTDRSGELGVIVDNESSIRLRTAAKRGRKMDLCNSCYEMLSVDSDGHVYPCAPLNGIHEFDLGSIHEQPLREIWLGSSKAELVRENSVALKEGCSQCDIRFLCGGGCFCQSYYSSQSGDIRAPDPYCQAHKDLFMKELWRLATPPGYKGKDKGYQPPMVLARMDPGLQSCSVPTTKVKDFSFETGTFHCTCVLSMELDGEDRIAGAGGNRLEREACFHERAHEYRDWLETPLGRVYNRFVKERVRSLLEIEEGMDLLEVGCGTGNYTLEFAEQGVHVVGVDSSEWMLRIAREKSHQRGLSIEFVHDYAEGLGFPDESFDMVFSMNMLEYPDKPEEVVEEMLRVLKPGGQLLMGVLNKNSLWGLTGKIKKWMGQDAYHGARFLDAEELLRSLNGRWAIDKEISSTIYFPPLNQPLLLKVSGIFERLGHRLDSKRGALSLIKISKKGRAER